MKSKTLIVLTFIFLVCLSSCETSETIVPTTKEVFSGFVQKGPFINGSSVMISELDGTLNQTGRSYSTTVADNTGSFEQKQIELISYYVQLKADGYYFNEVSGAASSGQLTLYAIADISQVNSANVNVLTHLEKSRVEYLVQQKGMTFTDAKKKAQTEVLNIFNLALPTDSTSESLNLTDKGGNNGILLAVSCILQGYLTTAEMSELMANIISDIKMDGVLDNAALGSQLIDNAKLLQLSSVRLHLQTIYTELGLGNVAIPNFEQYVNEFITKSTYIPVKMISYPLTGINGVNVLSDTAKIYKINTAYSMKAELPKGTSLKIVLKGKKSSWGYGIVPTNWTATNFNTTTESQEFKVTESDKPNDLYLTFNAASDSTIIEYYENNALTPTKTKVLKRLKSTNESSGIEYPLKGLMTGNENILHDSIRVTRAGKVYSLYANVTYQKTLKVVLKGLVKNWITFTDKNYGWTMGTYNSTAISQEFTTLSGKPDMEITFPTAEKIIIEIYENNALTPTKIKYLNN